MKYYLILFLFLNALLMSQSKVTGYVYRADNNYPLEYANVTIKNSQAGTTTDSNGYFELKYSSKDDLIVISYIGYENITLSLKDIADPEDVSVFLKTKVLSSQSVLVESTIGKEGESPVTFSQIDRKNIENNYTVQDVPEYISYLPSTTFYSEGGSGIGYNYLSIRGFDQRRISVSVNGIPQNEPEDHNVYWIDMPDLLESTQLIQVQRGAGSGVAGYPSVGGSINIITSPFSDRKEFQLYAGVGSYNTRKYTASFSSGLIDSKYSVYAKLGQTLTSGYRNGSWAKLNSYHISAVRYDKNLTTQINIFGGPLSDGLVYNGLAKFAIKDKDLRRENLSYFGATDSEYIYKAERRTDEIENFTQPHYELLNEYVVNENIKLNSALFLIIGDGFFDYDGSWGSYEYFRLTPENGFDVQGNPSELYSSNILIRAKVENKQWGWIPRASIKHANGTLIVGGELRFHNSIHWGALNHGVGLPDGVTKDYHYYYYEGGKDIINFFVNENYQLNDKLNILLEAQVAYHNYKIEKEKYLGNNFEISDTYFNPRVGVNYKFNSNLNSYIAYAKVTREPRLKNYYDAAESSGGATPQFAILSSGAYDFENPLVKPETMNNIELGTTYQDEDKSITINLFYMAFNDEIIKKGQLDRFGQPITGNIDKTIHTGIEISGKVRIAEKFNFIANASYSKNYISEGVQYLGSSSSIDLKDNSISGFPEMIANAILQYNSENLYAQFAAKYVGDFYSDNYDENLSNYLSAYDGFVDYSDNVVDSYFVVNFYASYELALGSGFAPIKIFGQVNNIFDNLYASHAVGSEFFPAAERNFLAGIKLGL